MNDEQYMNTPDELKPGDVHQWKRIRADRESRRAEAAIRNARMCGTDPSWYGF
jgi:hypothetical protein